MCHFWLYPGIPPFTRESGAHATCTYDLVPVQGADFLFNAVSQLLEFLEEKTQTFVSTSKESFVERFGRNAAVFEVRDGQPIPAPRA